MRQCNYISVIHIQENYISVILISVMRQCNYISVIHIHENYISVILISVMRHGIESHTVACFSILNKSSFSKQSITLLISRIVLCENVILSSVLGWGWVRLGAEHLGAWTIGRQNSAPDNCWVFFSFVFL